MNDTIFNKCLDKYLGKSNLTWEELAEQLDEYESGEQLRQTFKVQRKKRGIPSKGMSNVSPENVKKVKENSEIKNPHDYVTSFERSENENGAESRVVMTIEDEYKNILEKIFKTQNKTNDDLLVFHGFSVDEWEIMSAKSNGWNMPAGGGSLYFNFQSKITVKPKIKKGITFEDIDKYFENKQPVRWDYNLYQYKENKDGYVYEIDLADMHFGKIGVEDKNGISKIEDDVRNVLAEILHSVSTKNISRFVVTTVGDIFHFDTPSRTTTSGTSVEVDGRTLDELFNLVMDIIASFVFELSLQAPVEFIHVSGNHDENTSYFLAKALEYYFKDNDFVEIDASPTKRKWRRYNKVLIGWTHGNVNKGRLQKNFLQIEAREDWGLSDFAEIHVGHLHHEDTTEDGGLVLRYLPTISPTDEWHDKNLFVGNRRAIVCFLWDTEKGLKEIIFNHVR